MIQNDQNLQVITGSTNSVDGRTPATTWDIKKPENNGITAGLLPSIVLPPFWHGLNDRNPKPSFSILNMMREPPPENNIHRT